MTMTTHLLVLDPVPLDALWAFARDLVGATDETEWTDRKLDTTYPGGVTPSNIHRRANIPGQGCRALLALFYSPDGYIGREYGHEPGEEPDTPDYCYHLYFDTPYGASTCGHFQAYAVTELAAWLADRNARILWQDEYTGEWFDTLDQVRAKLGDPELGVEAGVR